MGYHPETLVCSFPPYPSGGTSLRNHPKQWNLARGFYALKPWIGFDVWHIDAERPNSGQRRDDSCGWFDRRAGDYAEAVEYLLKDASTIHEINLIIARKVETLAPFYEGISERQLSYPRLPAADCLALCLMVARELETRRWWNGKKGASGSWLRKILTKRRNVDDIALDLALDPHYNLSTPEVPESTIRLIAGALNRHFKPWWKHPRWHIHHWQIHFDLTRNIRRMFQRCASCERRLGFGYCPTVSGDKHYHGECLGSCLAAAA